MRKGLVVLGLVLAAWCVSAGAQEGGFVIENGVLVSYEGSASAVTVPSNVTSIGDWAFLGCESLTSLSLPAQKPPELGSDAFPSDARISVPAASLAAYKRPPGWEDYRDQLEAMR